MTIGIVGAGKLGTTLARLLELSDHTVLVSGSGDPEKIRLSLRVLAPHATATTTQELALKADLIVLALPLSKFHTIPADYFAGKVIIDAMNHWYEVDGPRSDSIPDNLSSSEAVQNHFKAAYIVKAISHIGYHELYDFHHADPLVAIAYATDHQQAKPPVAQLIEDLGFEALDIGELKNGQVLEPGHPGFGVFALKNTLLKQLAQ